MVEKRDETSAPDGEAPPSAPGITNHEAVRVLLVEARRAGRIGIDELLAAAPRLRVTTARADDVQGGLARLREGPFDVCVIEPTLPDGDGLHVVRAVQAREANIPVILLSEQGSPELDSEAMALGVTDFLDRTRLDARLLERTILYALARRRQAERLSHLAQYDELTGLANRALFGDRVGRALAWARRHGRIAAVMVIDLNGFKAVNDRLGHGAGDRLLRIVGERLRGRIRETDTLARMGGDEFALVIENLAKAEHAALVARKLLDAVAPPIDLDGEEVLVTASLGVALYPRDGKDGEALMRAADAAMYRAKAEGGNLCRFSSDSVERRVQRSALLQTDLRRGLANGEFVLDFQPQVTLAPSEVGVSGLIRWRHPELGSIGTERFLPLAEDCGLVPELADWLLEAGCRQLERWRAQGLGELRLALPLLSRRQLAWSDLAGRISRCLAGAGLAPEWLEIELAEELILADAQSGGAGLAALKRLGVRLALDAYGRGPTSLRGLQLGVLDTLKLSRELLEGVPEDGRRAAVAGALVELGRDLGLRVVAEGVDRQEQLAFLRARGCSAVQAFMSCPPLPAEVCTRWLRQAAARREPPRHRVPALPPPIGGEGVAIGARAARPHGGVAAPSDVLTRPRIDHVSGTC